MSKYKKSKFSLTWFLLGIMFATSLFGIAREVSFWSNHKADGIAMETGKTNRRIEIIKSVNAEEIYPEFVCPCCGKPLDPANICCGGMSERINYINAQIDKGFSEDEVMKNTVREFGIESLISKSKQKEFKEMLIAEAPDNAPKIIFTKELYDFGKVKQENGIVFTEFKFKNEGDSDLIIDKLSTSCGCTLASVSYKGKEGPTFTMPGHGKENPKNWSVSISPGDEAIMKVYYDPNAHGPQKKPTLSITRMVSIYSNDPVEFEKKIKIELEQIP